MSVKWWSGSAWNDASFIRYWTGSAWVDASTVKYWSGSEWVPVTFAGGGGGTFTVTASPGTAYGQEIDPNPPYATAVNVSSNAVTMTPNGGSGTPSYSWTRISGDSSIVASNPNSASTTFSASVFRNNDRSAVFRGTCIRGADTGTVDVPVNLSYYTGDLA